MSRNFQSPQYQPSPTGVAGPQTLSPAPKQPHPVMASGPKMAPMPTSAPAAPAPMRGIGFVRPGMVQK